MAEDDFNSADLEDQMAAMLGPQLDPLAGEGGGDEGRRMAAYWIDQIHNVKSDREHSRWFKRGEKIEKRYRDERNFEEDGQNAKVGGRKYNALWSNIQVLLPALYGRCPLPVAERKFKDQDPAGRSAAQMLERALRNEIEICGYHESMNQAVQDYLLPGRGTLWVRYEPEFGESVSVPPDDSMDLRDAQGQIDEDDNPEFIDMQVEEGELSQDEAQDDKLLETGSRIIRESTPVDYINWKDFFTFPIKARVWPEVVAVCKRVYMTRDQLVKRFGPEIGKSVPLLPDERFDGRRGNVPVTRDAEDKAHVYEIWCKTDTEVYWVAEGYEYLLDRQDDPLRLSGFFPVPRPLYANPTTGTLVPVPDYIQYQDQAIQIDELTGRIAMLAKACKVAGVYNAAARDIRRVFEESLENELIPVQDWAAFAKDGAGVAGNISFVPLKEVMGVLQELMLIKNKQIEEMDRLTGINDIMRGTSDARETLGGVRLKSNNTGTRLTYRQNEIARFAKDTLCIMAEIMCRHFSPRSLIETSGALYAEGLGPSSMPTLVDMQSMAPPPQQPPMLPAPAPPSGAVAGPPGVPPPSPGGPPLMGPPSMPMGAPGGQPPMGGWQMPTPIGGATPGMAGGLPPQLQQLQQQLDAIQRIVSAIQLLRNERLRGFRVDIEVDSTIYGDSAQEKKDRIEFLQMTTQYLQTAGAMAAEFPDIAPLLGKMLQFGVRGFKVGRDLEVAISEFVEASPELIAKMKAQKQQQQQNPAEAAKAQATIAAAQVDLENTKMKGAMDMQAHQAELERQDMEAKSEAFNAMLESERKRQDQMMLQMETYAKQMESNAQLLQTLLTLQQTRHDGQQQMQRQAVEKMQPMMPTHHQDKSGASNATSVQTKPPPQ